MIIDWLRDNLRRNGEDESFKKYSRPQLKILVRLNTAGRARLKDIARREGIPSANLCAAFRKLESNGLILREVDAADRRNTWYSVSKAGAATAREAIKSLHRRVSDFFEKISREDGEKLVGALRQINEILNGIKCSQ
ncbi:MAG: MarR family transcriptional regulator [Rickettsiales bacterium]|nr:MarR family transcriptional regulator [Rickettsiales bacterium]